MARQTSTGVAIAIACVAGFGLAGALAATRTLPRAVGNAALLGLALAGVYHVAAAALQIRPGPSGPAPADAVAGLPPQRIGLPVIVTAAVVLALCWYFTLGTATVRDLRLIFQPDSDAEQIEPWMIEQVRTRVALSSTAYAPVPGWPEVWAPNEPTVAVRAVQVGRGIADAFAQPMPGRTRPELTTAPANLAPVDGPAPQASPPAPHGPAPQASPEQAPAPDGWLDWRGVPDWVLPTSGWSQAEVDDATGRTGPREEWPTPGRNEAPAARRVLPLTKNSRYGPPRRPVSPAPDLSQDAGDTAADWRARLRAAASRAAAEGNGAGVVITRENEDAPPLPRRNARPIDRP